MQYVKVPVNELHNAQTQEVHVGTPNTLLRKDKDYYNPVSTTRGESGTRREHICPMGTCSLIAGYCGMKLNRTLTDNLVLQCMLHYRYFPWCS